MTGADGRQAGFYALNGQPKTVEEAVDRMQYFQHSKEIRPLRPSYNAVRSVVVGEVKRGGDGRAESEIRELRSSSWRRLSGKSLTQLG